MLRILDRYIIRKFLTTFVFVVLIFTLVTVVVDFSGKVHKFVGAPVPVRQILWVYYPCFSLFIDGLLWPVFTMISVVFFTSRMADNAEIRAMLHSGISFRRVLRPYLLTGSLIALCSYFNNHYLIPLANQKWLDIEYNYLSQDQDEGPMRDVHLFISPDTKIYLALYQKNDTSGHTFWLEQYRDQQVVKYVKAQRLRWAGPPDHWLLHNYEIRTFQDLQEGLLVGKGQVLDTSLNLFPEDFVDYKAQQTTLPTPRLKDYIRRQEARSATNSLKYRIEVYRRTADAVTTLLLALIGMAIAAREVRGGTSVHLTLGIAIGALFILLSRFSAVFAGGQVLSPQLGIWMPNLIFGLIAAILLLGAQK